MVIEIKRNEPQKTMEDVLEEQAKRTRLKPAPVGTPPKRTRAPNGTFDRTAYQREYMRDVKFAKAEGLTVYEWRKKHGKH